MKFQVEKISKWDTFLQKLPQLQKDKWVFRGHGKDYALSTSLERARKDFNIRWTALPGIEEQMIRFYRRGFPEEREDELTQDKLYCISLMQHYGAPTRLLDFTWSPYVGAFFALESADMPAVKTPEMPVLWCINIDWIEGEVKKIVDDKLLGGRWCDNKRNDTTFVPIYMGNCREKFVYLENPIRLNVRLVIQQGIFLCPGDVAFSFENNLKNLNGWNNKNNVLKIYFKFSKKEFKSALEALRRMNITQASLFPGLDGYSRSMRQMIPFFERMSKARAGKGGKYTLTC